MPADWRQATIYLRPELKDEPLYHGKAPQQKEFIPLSRLVFFNKRFIILADRQSIPAEHTAFPYPVSKLYSQLQLQHLQIVYNRFPSNQLLSIPVSSCCNTRGIFGRSNLGRAL